MRRFAKCLLFAVACDRSAPESEASDPVATPTVTPPTVTPPTIQVAATPPSTPTKPRWSARPTDDEGWHLADAPPTDAIDIGLRVAVRRQGKLRLHELHGGELVIGGDFSFAIAHDDGRFETPTIDAREILPKIEDPTEFGYGFMDWNMQILGRWPDDVLLAHEVQDGRLAFPYEMHRLVDHAWQRVDNDLPGALAWAYFEATPWTHGTSLGRRTFSSTADTIEDPEGGEMLPRKARRALDRALKGTTLDVIGGDAKPPRFGARVRAWDSLATGHAIGIVGTGVVHVAPGVPAKPYALPELVDSTASVRVEMVSPTRAYVFGTARETPDDDAATPYIAAFDGQRWQALARPPLREPLADIDALSASADGTLWILAEQDLWRWSAAAGWQRIAIPAAVLPTVDAAPTELALVPEQVIARGPEDVWVACRSGDDRGAYGSGAVLHTRDHGDVLQLPSQADLFAAIVRDRQRHTAAK